MDGVAGGDWDGFRGVEVENLRECEGTGEGNLGRSVEIEDAWADEDGVVFDEGIGEIGDEFDSFADGDGRGVFAV